MIEAQYLRAVELLTTHKEKLTTLAELLLEKEVIFKNDLEKIFGKRPFDVETQPLKEAKIEEEKDVAISPVEENTGE